MAGRININHIFAQVALRAGGALLAEHPRKRFRAGIGGLSGAEAACGDFNFINDN